jgi:DNA-binding MarR family transcriptional regulator
MKKLSARLDPQNNISCLISQLDHSVGQEIAAALADLSLTTLQLQVLAELAKEPGISTADLARLTFVTPQNMSLAVSKLVDRGYLLRGLHPINSRINRLDLTASGHRILDRAVAIARRVERRTFATLLPRERKKLLDVLRRSLVQFKRSLASPKPTKRHDRGRKSRA